MTAERKFDECECRPMETSYLAEGYRSISPYMEVLGGKVNGQNRVSFVGGNNADSVAMQYNALLSIKCAAARIENWHF